MTLYHFQANRIEPVSTTTFKATGLKERSDIQRLLRDQIEILSKDLLVIAEEFCDWEDSNRRIDLLGIDKNANLVVIELKRDDSGHMELQALRYAAMVSTMTWRKAVEIFAHHLASLGREEEADGAETTLLKFLDWEEPYESRFAQEVRIILSASSFTKELTTTVMWLNDKHGLDIRCIRMSPYVLGDQTLVDVQQIIPLPEASEFQTRLREKAILESADRQHGRDLTKFEVELDGARYSNLPKRWAMWRIVQHLIKSDVDPEQITKVLAWDPWLVLEGELDAKSFKKEAAVKLKGMGRSLSKGLRYFHSADELIHRNGRTYAFTTQWGEPRFSQALADLSREFPNQFTYRAER